MANVDDHGLEVLKKAARDIGAKPKTDYALQTHITNPSALVDAGLSTSAKQDTAQATLNSINNKTPPLTPSGNTRVEPFLPPNYSRGVLGARRVVTTQNVFESLFSFDKQSSIWDEAIVAGGTSTFNPNTNSVDMTVNTAVGASAVRQTFRRVRYNPSRTVQFIAAGALGAPKAGVRKRIGQFDAQDGLFLEQDGLVVSVVRRSSASGTVVDTKIPQSLWNIDKFDGTGPSGIIVDFSKHQAIYCQYAFQGFADICYGFYLNGQISFCHREQTSNTLSSPFMKTAHLPCRVEITNTAATASPTTLSYSSFVVKNEGEDSETEGRVLSYSDGPLRTVTTTTTPVISVRLAPSYEKAIADLIATSIFVKTLDEVIWTIWLNPTLSAPAGVNLFTVNASYTQIDINATSQTGGTELISGFLSQNFTSAAVSQQLLSLINSLIGTSINGTSQIITLSARSRTGTADILASLIWREYP